MKKQQTAFPSHGIETDIEKDSPSGQPYPRTYSYSESGGMTMKQWYKGHAPIEPQAWFSPKMGTEKPGRILGLDEHGETVLKNFAEIDAWDNEYARQRLIQWPGAWADAMLSEDAASTPEGKE